MVSVSEFEDVLAEFKKGLSADERADFEFTTITDVYNEIARIQKLQEKRGMLRNLRRIEPFITGMVRYSQVIEVFVSAKPNILAFIWVSVIQYILSVRKFCTN